MVQVLRATVHLRGDLRGSADLAALERNEGTVEVHLDDGRAVEAPASAFERRGDGSYFLPIGLEAAPASTSAVGSASGAAVGETVIPVVVEEAEISKRVVETGRVRVVKRVRQREETVDEPLFREEVRVERVPVNRPVEGPVEVREEGGVTIVPVVEEVLVVEKRLVLREEVRITRVRVEEHRPQAVSLRSEEVEVDRVPNGAAREPAV